MQSPIDLDAYFSRIGFEGSPEPTRDTLEALHYLHPLAIPFENLAPLLGMDVALDPASLQEKLIEKRRGGYCFEQNLLFAQVLRTLGFQVTGLSARVLWHQRSLAVPRTHMLLLLEFGGEAHLADVGFGAMTQTGLLRLQPDVEQATPHESYRIERSQDGYVLSAQVAGEWKALYAFDLQVQNQADYEVANWYVSRHPASRFVRELVAGRPGTRCRHALLDNRYARYHLDGRVERRVLSVDELLHVLHDVFGIDMAHLPGARGRLQSLCERSNPDIGP